MGYFRRPIDRGRSKREAESLARQPMPELPWQPIPSSPPAKLCWVRFSSLSKHGESGLRAGLFTTAGEALDSKTIDSTTAAGIQSALDWFNENLAGPDIENPKAVWFFRSTATECMARAWELVHWLREAGAIIEMQTMEGGEPGWILFEDQEQIAVIPHPDSDVH